MKPHKGLTLIEVLISLFILSIGLLAILKTQVYSLQAVNNAYYTSQAIMRTESLKALYSIQAKNFANLYQHWQRMNAKLLPQTTSLLTGNELSLSWHDRFTGKQQKISCLLSLP